MSCNWLVDENDVLKPFTSFMLAHKSCCYCNNHKPLFSPSGTQRPRPRGVAAGDQPGEAAVGQEEEGGDAPETRGQDDEDHESPVSAHGKVGRIKL